MVGLGESSLDIVARIDRWPAPDRKMAASRFELLPGGQTATALVACARLGWRARYFGCLGADAWGDRIVAGLRREGVDVSVVRRAGAASRTAMVLVDGAGGRTVIEYRDAQLRLAPGEMDLDAITSGRVLIVDATDPAASIAAAKAARRLRIPTVVDVDRAGSRVEELLAEIDVIIVDHECARELTGRRDPGAALAALDVRYRPAVTVVTLGPGGSIARHRGGVVRTPAAEVDVVDTTGAGDAFRGGFIAAWLRAGSAARLDRVLREATAVAALSCHALGAQAGLPDRRTLHRFVTGGRRGESK